MHTLSYNSVVEEIVGQLAERRHEASQRRAYVALARAILQEEECAATIDVETEQAA